MHAIVDFLKALYNAERLLELARTLLSSPLGVAGLFGIIFAETGLLVGFFLPGDSLLFSVGFASGAAGVNLYLLAGLLMCAAIIGDNVGYFLGKQSGPRIFRRPKSRFFHPDHLQTNEEILREVRCPCDRIRAVHPDHPDLYSIRFRRRGNAVSAISLLQSARGDALDRLHDDCRLQVGPGPDCTPEFREGHFGRYIFVAAADVHGSFQGLATEIFAPG